MFFRVRFNNFGFINCQFMFLCAHSWFARLFVVFRLYVIHQKHYEQPPNLFIFVSFFFLNYSINISSRVKCVVVAQKKRENINIKDDEMVLMKNANTKMKILNTSGSYYQRKELRANRKSSYLRKKNRWKMKENIMDKDIYINVRGDK